MILMYRVVATSVSGQAISNFRVRIRTYRSRAPIGKSNGTITRQKHQAITILGYTRLHEPKKLHGRTSYRSFGHIPILFLFYSYSTRTYLKTLLIFLYE